MGVAFLFGEIKFVQLAEPPSPQPSPSDGRGGRLQQMGKGIEGDSGGCEMFAVI